MDIYLERCYRSILYTLAGILPLPDGNIEIATNGPDSVREIVRRIEIGPTVNGYTFKFNYNENGDLHSKYLGDRHEPAITISHYNMKQLYYLSNGVILDCIHPFSILVINENDINVTYYSTERITTEQPINIEINAEIYGRARESYNYNHDVNDLLDGYYSGDKMVGNIYNNIDFTLHDYIEDYEAPLLLFKFVD